MLKSPQSNQGPWCVVMLIQSYYSSLLREKLLPVVQVWVRISENVHHPKALEGPRSWAQERAAQSYHQQNHSRLYYTEWITKLPNTNPKTSPLKLEAMLQELFEGWWIEHKTQGIINDFYRFLLFVLAFGWNVVLPSNDLYPLPLQLKMTCTIYPCRLVPAPFWYLCVTVNFSTRLAYPDLECFFFPAIWF